MLIEKVEINKTHTRTPKTQRKITLNMISLYENKGYHLFTPCFTKPSLFIGKIWTPSFHKNLKDSNRSFGVILTMKTNSVFPFRKIIVHLLQSKEKDYAYDLNQASNFHLEITAMDQSFDINKFVSCIYSYTA